MLPPSYQRRPYSSLPLGAVLPVPWLIVEDAPPIRIASHDSPLALARAHAIRRRLEALGARVELLVAFDPARPATRIARAALLAGRADLAVHAHGDLPPLPAPGLEVAAVPERADPRELLLVRAERFAPDGGPLPLPQGARVGSDPGGRERQLLALRPDLETLALPDSLLERVALLRPGQLDALVTAAADAALLDLAGDDLEWVPLAQTQFVPAPAQGALALEIRRDDYPLAQTLTDLHHPLSYRCVAAEWGLATMLQGATAAELGAIATFEAGRIVLHAWFRGRTVTVEHPSSEGAAMLAFDALGRP